MKNLFKQLALLLVIMSMFLVTAHAETTAIAPQEGPVLIQFDFAYTGPFGADMTVAMTDLAKSITQEPGFIWKIWTENTKTQEAGGIYLFENEKTAQAYIIKHSARLKTLGINQVNTKVFQVNVPLTAITKGTLSAP